MSTVVDMASQPPLISPPRPIVQARGLVKRFGRVVVHGTPSPSA